MAPRILFLVHIEDSFEQHFPQDMIFNILERAHEFDRIVHFTSYIQDDCPVDDLRSVVSTDEEWSWGYAPEMYKFDSDYNKKERRWLIESNGHEYTIVPNCLRNGEFKDAEIFVGGGSRGECLTDFISALEFVELPYKIVHDFTYP